MFLDMKVADIVTRRLAAVSPIKPMPEIRQTLEHAGLDAVLVFNQVNWGVITREHLDRKVYRAVEAADFRLLVRDVDFLDNLVKDRLDLLAENSILFMEDSRPAALYTPAMLICYLYRQGKADAAVKEALFAAMGEAVCLIDQDGVVTAWNHSAERLYGISAANILGRKLEDIVSGSVLPDVLRSRRLVEGILHSPRNNRQVLLNARPVLSGEIIMGALAAEQDVTELGRLRDELERTRHELSQARRQLMDRRTEDGPLFATGSAPPVSKLGGGMNLVAQTEEMERTMIEAALAECGGNKARTAKKLGIPRGTLYYKLEQLGLYERDS